MIYQARLVHKGMACHGESSWWDERKQVMLYLDCAGTRLFCYSPAHKAGEEVQLPFHPMAVVGCEKGGYIANSEDTIYLLDDRFQTIKELAKVIHDKESDRFNDCKCGPDGAFYMGSMGTYGETDEGKLYRYTPEGNLSVVIDKVGISNGFAWSKDRKTLYYTDTIHGEIYAYDFADGRVSNKRVVFADKNLQPDGMCIDTQGCLWVALWGSGKVICVNPKNGVVLHEVLVDGAKLTSSVAFGGENLDTLFITTSQLGLQRSDLDDNPLSGSLFAAHVDAVGTPLFRGGF